MVEKDIEVNEREITEMEEEFENLEKLHSDDIETEEGARYLSLKLQSSVTVHNPGSVLCLNSALDICTFSFN